MAGPKLDGAGNIKMATLESAVANLQRCHAIVERAAVDLKNNRPVGPNIMALKRSATPMIGQLKGQFGMISDQVVAFLLAATRGNDQQKVRAMREGVAQVRTALEIAMTRVKDQHTVLEEKKESAPPAE